MQYNSVTYVLLTEINWKLATLKTLNIILIEQITNVTDNR